MENNPTKPHIVNYSTYLVVLIILLLLTGATVAITGLQLGPWNSTAAMLIAATKASLVLLYFMHLKFDNKLISTMVIFVLAVFIAVIVITFLDYFYR